LEIAISTAENAVLKRLFGKRTEFDSTDYPRNQNSTAARFLSNIPVQPYCMRSFRTLVFSLIVATALLALGSQAARFLVVDQPAPSDAIVVLAGETYRRPAQALELFHRGLAPHVFLDAEAHDKIYGQLLPDLARGYLNNLGESSHVSVCEIAGASTFSEADDVNKCLQSLGAHRVLIVTSEYHTRRAAMIFRHRLPQYEIFVAAARDSSRFGERWWTRREWAKTTFDEWIKMIWWEAVDRWR
jgi:uncharacterized SAM-binding protein YcdF (DUF218 family)